ncbi:uncharacterized protein LOC126827382 [Patella vulgata]|uniref:uncharacterized protein LOC126827382 n=1 Tax=Patella vulgata TaxID=6465 RepID=UPI00217FC10B|nr:uncharacterized protein LOC126827382 [Patella vulgata]
MKDFPSSSKLKNNVPKKKKSAVPDGYEARIRDIKKRLESDKDYLNTPPKKHYPSGCHATRFTAYGGTVKREGWDEEVIYGTDDELVDDLDAEMKYLDAWEYNHRLQTNQDPVFEGYDDSYEQFEDNLTHIIKPKQREPIGFRKSSKDTFPKESAKRPPHLDAVDDGSEYLDGVLSIAPDNLLSSTSKKNVPKTSENRSKSPQKQSSNQKTMPRRNNIKQPEINTKPPKMNKTKHSNPMVLGLLSPSKQTQTEFSTFQDVPTSSKKQSHTSSLSVSNNFGGITEDMESFAQSLEDLDEAIYLNSLTRKHSHRRHFHDECMGSYLPNQKNEPQSHNLAFSSKNTSVSKERNKTSDHKVKSEPSPRSLVRSRREDLDFVAIESKNNVPENVNNSGKFRISVCSHLMDEQRHSNTKSESQPFFLTESLDRVNHKDKPQADGVRKRLFDSEFMEERSASRRDPSKTFNSESGKCFKSPRLTDGTDIFATSLEEQSKLRSSGEVSRTKRLSITENNSMSPRSEETLFNISTDFADKRLKQSNLYLEDSLEKYSPRLGIMHDNHIFDLESSRVEKRGSSLINKIHQNSPSAITDDAGPMPLKDLESMDDKVADATVKQQSIQTLRNKTSPRESIFKHEDKCVHTCIPKLELHRSPREGCTSPVNSDRTSHVSRNKLNEILSSSSKYTRHSPSPVVSGPQNDVQMDCDSYHGGDSVTKNTFLQDVKDFRDNLFVSKYCNFDTDQSIFDTESCEDVSFDLSRIDDCSFGPWEVDSRSRRDVEKLIINRRNSTCIQSDSSPTKQSNKQNRIDTCNNYRPSYRSARTCSKPSDVSSKSVHTKSQDPQKCHPKNNSLQQNDVSSKSIHTKSQESPQKIILKKNSPQQNGAVNFVHVQKMQDDVLKRLHHSDNIEHLLDIEHSTRYKKSTGNEKDVHPSKRLLTEASSTSESNKLKTLKSTMPSKTVTRDSLSKIIKQTIPITRPVQVNSLNINQSIMNFKNGENRDTEGPLTKQQSKCIDAYVPSKLHKCSRNLAKSSQRHSVSPTSKKKRLESDNDFLDFEERGRKLDEISGILSHSLNKQSNTQRESLIKPVEFRFGRLYKCTRNSKKREDVEKPFKKEIKGTRLDNDVTNRRYRFNPNSLLVKNQEFDIKASRKHLSDAVDVVNVNNLNFNSSLLHEQSQDDETASNSIVEDMQWLSTALGERYQNRHGYKTSTVPDGREKENRMELSSGSDSDVPKKLTMSDLYTPVTQLITDEIDEMPMRKEPTVSEDEQLPMETVCKNLMNKKKLENDLSASNKLETGNVNGSLIKDTKLTNGFVNKMPHDQLISSQPMMAIPNKVSTGLSLPCRSSTPFNSVDVILSHLNNSDSINLLQRLYQADDKTRDELMIKAEYFKRWQRKIHDVQHDRLIYGPTRARIRNFCLNNLVKKHFTDWRNKTEELMAERKADELYRQHMLKKGLDGFKWAIYRSQHYHDIMKSRTQSILLNKLFIKWRTRAYNQRQNRLVVHFIGWHDYTEEQKRARSFCQNLKLKLIRKSFTKWIHRYSLKLKENKADRFARQSMLSHSLIVWKMFSNSSRIKKQRNKQADDLYKRNLEKKIFEKMIISYQQIQKAKLFHRVQVLSCALTNWQEGAVISYKEQETNLKISLHHWKAKTTKCFFYLWKEAWKTKQAVRMDKLFTERNCFLTWKKVWLTRLQKQKEIEICLSSQKLSRHFVAWKNLVRSQKEKREKLTCHIEGVLLQVRLNDWYQYTRYKINLRSKCESFRRKSDDTLQRECFIIWLEKYLKHVSEEQARQLWSDTCLRKSVEKWKLNCRNTRLNNLLVETEPDRELALVKAMFKKWQMAKAKMDQEKLEAAEVRKQLQKSKLQRTFQIWKTAMMQIIKIQPMIKSRHTSLLKQCFQSWHSLVEHKVKCYENQNELIKERQRKIFCMWKRQYEICQLEKQIKRVRMEKLTHVCLTEWRNIIKRKQTADKFHKEYLQKCLFEYWKSRTTTQIHDKIQAIEEQENNASLKKYYFNLWFNNILCEKRKEEDKIVTIQQQQSYSRVRHSFYTWKHQLHITLIARVYQRSLMVKQQRKILQAWCDTTNYSLQDAVTQFSLRLGLPVQDTDQTSSMSDMSFDRYSIRSGDSVTSCGDKTLIDSPRSCSTQITCTSLNRLFAGLAGETSLDLQKLDLDNQSLLSGIESAIYDEREAKIQRLQELVRIFVVRFSNWPVSIVFDQWKEFVIRQRELKEYAQQVEELSQSVKLKLAFRAWKKQFYGMEKAKNFRNKVVMSSVVTTLKDYQKNRQTKKQLSALALRHHMITVMKKIFPVWADKTKEKQHKENILHLWTTATVEEQTLFPLEKSFTSKLNKRSLRLCFSIWLVKFQFSRKIQKAYHLGILRRTLTEWKNWAQDSQERKKKCQQFQRKHIQQQMFNLWKIKLQQKQQVEDRYQTAWTNYLGLIFSKWRQWARGNHRDKDIGNQLIMRSNINRLQYSFKYWHSLTIKSTQVREAHSRYLAKRTLHGWQEVSQEKKAERKTILQFQVQSYTALVKRLFQTWKEKYQCRLNQHEEKEKNIQNRALDIGRKWHQKAMKSRGVLFSRELEKRKLVSYFGKWKSANQRVIHLNNVLDKYIGDRNNDLVSRMLDEWKSRMLLSHVDRIHAAKLQVTMFTEWHLWATGVKERRIRALALKKALEERSLHLYFKLWKGKTQVNQSVQQHYNTRLQIKMLHSWHIHAQKKKTLQANYILMTAKVRRNKISKTFHLLRNRFDYCQGLNEIASRIQVERKQASQRQSLLIWHNKLDHIMSQRCYGKFLAWRVARQWRNFVCSKKAQRQKEADQEELAIKHYNNLLCKMVFEAMKTERCVTQQKERHKERLVNKYGRLWKWKVDLAYTAKCVRNERLIKKFWLNWRVEYSERKAATKVQSFYKRQLLAQVFTSWRNLKRKTTKSSIPVPVSTNSIKTYNNGYDSSRDCVSPVFTKINPKDMYGIYSYTSYNKQKSAVITSKSVNSSINGLTKSNIRKIISRPDKLNSKIPSSLK